jgi:hypothetical protein
MQLYRVTAQCIIGLNRIARVMSARSEADVLRMVSPVLMDAGYYLLDIQAV